MAAEFVTLATRKRSRAHETDARLKRSLADIGIAPSHECKDHRRMVWTSMKRKCERRRSSEERKGEREREKTDKAVRAQNRSIQCSRASPSQHSQVLARRVFFRHKPSASHRPQLYDPSTVASTSLVCDHGSIASRVAHVAHESSARSELFLDL